MAESSWASKNNKHATCDICLGHSPGESETKVWKQSFSFKFNFISDLNILPDCSFKR